MKDYTTNSATTFEQQVHKKQIKVLTPENWYKNNVFANGRALHFKVSITQHYHKLLPV